jgi:hypothetical protein
MMIDVLSHLFLERTPFGIDYWAFGILLLPVELTAACGYPLLPSFPS